IMGVADRFLARSKPATQVNFNAGRRELVQLRFRDFAHLSGSGAFSPRALTIPQSETEAILGDVVRERGGAVEWDTELVSFEQRPAGAVALLKRAGRQEVVRAAWLVSCEGAHSVVRKQAGIDFAGKTYPLAFFMADVELGWDRSHDEVHFWM